MRARGWYYLKLKGKKTGIPEHQGGDWMPYYWTGECWYGHPEITEDQIEGPRRKYNRSISTSLTQWESFGPMGVADKNDPTGNQVFGRIRTMRWYYNTGSSTWERYLGAGMSLA